MLLLNPVWSRNEPTITNLKTEPSKYHTFAFYGSVQHGQTVRMKLSLDQQTAKNYTSLSQKARVLTESWVGASVFCPNCGHSTINQYPNNRPVADFYCPSCQEQYELKSRQGGSTKIVDGAYRTMIQRLQGQSNPNLFLLNYKLQNLQITDFYVIPKHFFTTAVIEERRPLAVTARRAGWIGCNILLSRIPLAGQIYFVNNGATVPKNQVVEKWQKTLFLKKINESETRSWLLDVVASIEKLEATEFRLIELYGFENELQQKHPANKHIRDKIRQQLQILRDNNYLEFRGGGRYRLT